MQRRIIKVCEDIKVEYDGSARDTVGKVYQLAYGENNFDPCTTININGQQQFCNIARMVDRLNMKHELNTN